MGKGPNKKDAKRNAAENLLVEMGYESELKRRSIKNNDIPLVNSYVMISYVLYYGQLVIINFKLAHFRQVMRTKQILIVHEKMDGK